MDNEKFVSVINFLKGKTETDIYTLDIFNYWLTAIIQHFLHHRFLTERIEG